MWIALWVQVSAACTGLPLVELAVDPGSTDAIAPGASSVTAAVRRGRGPTLLDADDCAWVSNSCDDIGSMTLTVSATDDVTPAEGLGWLVSIAGPPEGPAAPAFPVVAPDGTVALHWEDGASDDQEPLSFTVTVAAVDGAGNVGPTTTLTVEDPGSEAGAPSACDAADTGSPAVAPLPGEDPARGCDHLGGSPTVGGLLALFGLRRRRF